MFSRVVNVHKTGLSVVVSACEAANASLLKKPQLAKRRVCRDMIHKFVGCVKNRSDSYSVSAHFWFLPVATFGNLPVSCVRVCVLVSFSCLRISVHDNHIDPVCWATHLGNSLSEERRKNAATWAVSKKKKKKSSQAGCLHHTHLPAETPPFLPALRMAEQDRGQL